MANALLAASVQVNAVLTLATLSFLVNSVSDLATVDRSSQSPKLLHILDASRLI
jgi:hypothetical protein